MQGSASPNLKRPFSWLSLLGDVGLLALVSGPVAAPFLAASGLPLLPLIADLIYAMGNQVCPQPDMGLTLVDGYQMAVCMRCYGTVAGLVLMRGLYYRDRGQGAYWLEQYGRTGFIVTLIICLAYPLELALQGFPWWGLHQGVMTGFGLIAGLGLGAYLMPVLHGEPSDTLPGSST